MLTFSRGQKICLAIGAVLAIYLTWPGGATLNYSTCEPKSGLSQLSATLYGRYFWETALTHARELALGLEKQNNDWAKTFNSSKLQPNAGVTEAERLRDRADQIEAQQAWNHLSSMYASSIANVRQCEQLIVARLRLM